MFTRTFWKDALERAVATAGQAALALLGADGFNLLHVDAADVLGVAAGGFVLAIIKALIASRIHNPDSASLVDLPGDHAAPEER